MFKLREVLGGHSNTNVINIAVIGSSVILGLEQNEKALGQIIIRRNLPHTGKRTSKQPFKESR